MFNLLIVVAGNLGGSGLRLTKMAGTGGGVFKPVDGSRIVIPGSQIETEGVETVVKKHVRPMEAEGLCIGMAGPVTDGVGDMTWLNATLSEQALEEASGTHVLLVNDMPPLPASLWLLRSLSQQGYFNGKYSDSSSFVTLSNGNRFSTEEGAMFGFAPGTGTGTINASISDNGTRLHIYPAEESHRPMGVASKLDNLFFNYLGEKYGYTTEEIATRNSCVKDAFDFWVKVAKREIRLPHGCEEIAIVKEVLKLREVEDWVLAKLRNDRVDANKCITNVALHKYQKDTKRSVFCEIAQAHVARNIGLALGGHGLKLVKGGIWLGGSIIEKIEPVLLDREEEYLGPLTFHRGFLDREGDKFYGVVGQHRVTGIRPELAFDLGLAELWASQHKDVSTQVGYPEDRTVKIFS